MPNSHCRIGETRADGFRLGYLNASLENDLVRAHPRHVLIAEPVSEPSWTLVRTLLDFGVQVASTQSVASTLRHISASAPDFILTELKFCDGTGFEILEAARLNAPDARVVVHTSWMDPRLAARCASMGAKEVVPKPVDATFLSDLVLHGNGYSDLVVSLQHPDDVRSKHIEQVLAASGGNISETARVLNMHRRTLQRHLVRSALRR